MTAFLPSSDTGLTIDPIARTFIGALLVKSWRTLTRKNLGDGRQNAIVANDNFEVIHAMRIAVLALEALWASGLTVTLDAFSTVNLLAARLMGGTPRFDVTIVGVRRKVRSGQGL